VFLLVWAEDIEVDEYVEHQSSSNESQRRTNDTHRVKDSCSTHNTQYKFSCVADRQPRAPMLRGPL